jgi:DNA-binding transcriptional MerR regulator
MKRGGGRRFYRPDDLDLLRGIRHLLYGEGYTIRGVQRILREQGSKFVEAVWQEGAPPPPHGARDDELADEAPSETEARKPGLLGRLIGRDLADSEDDAPERPEPPMQSAPVPRIEPELPVSEEVELPPEPSFVAPARQSAPAAFSRDDLGKLHAALHELGECRKLIDKALTR